jgi:hypothetical protein
LVPATKIVGEKATILRRSRLLVVEPHSRSLWPDVIEAIRVSGVTGCQRISSARPTSSAIASTSSLHRSIE